MTRTGRLFTLCFLFVPAMVWGNGEREIAIEEAWIREAPPGVSPLAGYLELHNRGPETVVLNDVHSEAFARVELHRTRIDGEVARMERQDELTLAPGETIRLEPGGYHLMLFRPSRPLRAGDRVTLTFSFKDWAPRTIEAEVRRHDDGEAGHHHHQHRGNGGA